ncbi:hypothetical protein Q3G72_023818 [Acer saccharum]|nr:hypothetical protein Q3G72_023818 [Acer saccharum]
MSELREDLVWFNSKKMKSKYVKHKKWDWVSVIEDKRTGEQDHELQKEKEMKSDLKLEKEITNDHELEKMMNSDLSLQ